MPRGCRANEKVISAFEEEYVQRLQVSVVSGPRNQIKKARQHGRKNAATAPAIRPRLVRRKMIPTNRRVRLD